MIYFDEKFKSAVRKYRHKNALVYLRGNGEKTSFTYEDLARNTERIVADLRKIGIQSGDRVALIARSSPSYAMVAVALACAHCTAVLIDASLPEREIESLLGQGDVSAAFVDGKRAEALPMEMRREIPLFFINDTMSYVKSPTGAVKTRSCNINDQDESLIAIIFSSGTTDRMKGICLPHSTITLSLEPYRRLTGITKRDKYLITLPFNHIAGYAGLMQHILLGCELGMIEDSNSMKLEQAFQDYEPTFFAMVPRVYEIMQEKIISEVKVRKKEKAFFTLMDISRFCRKRLHLNLGKVLFRRLRTQCFGRRMKGLGVGATPCKQETADFFLALGYSWANFYSSTETGVPGVATGIHDPYPENTVGNIRQFKEISVKIREPDTDGVGEILIRTPLGMKEYFRAPELTRKTIDSDGYIATGDLGYVDARDNLHITARQKECIILHNGKKISPLDIENLYRERLGEQTELACCGIANPQTGYDDIHLFLQNDGLAAGAAINNLRRISAEMPETYRIANYHVVAQLPRTAMGKVKRLTLREMVTDSVREPKETETESLPGIWAILREITHRPVEENPMLNFREDLQLDSLGLFELSVLVQENYHVSLAGKLDKLNTVGDLLNCIDESQGNKTEHFAPIEEEFPKRRSKRDIRKLSRYIRLFSLPYAIRTLGGENIPREGNFILCSNHINNLDPFWILSAGRGRLELPQIVCFAARERMEQRAERHLFHLLGAIPVDRSGNSAPAMGWARRCLLEQNQSLLIFPEGGRSRDGTMLPFKRGAAQLAIDTGRPILPVRIDGAYEVFPRSRTTPRLFHWKKLCRYEIRITFGKPILPVGSPEELTKELQDAIRAGGDHAK